MIGQAKKLLTLSHSISSYLHSAHNHMLRLRLGLGLTFKGKCLFIITFRFLPEVSADSLDGSFSSIICLQRPIRLLLATWATLQGFDDK